MGRPSPHPPISRTGGRARPGGSRCGPAGGVCATCGGERPPCPPPPPRRRRGLRVSLLLSARSRLRRGAAASVRGTLPSKVNEAPGVKLLCCTPPRSVACAPLPPPAGGLFSSASSQPPAPSPRERGAPAPRPPSCPGFPGRFCSCRGRRRGPGKLRRVVVAWLPVSLTFLRADSRLPCNFLFRGKSCLQARVEGRGGGDSRRFGEPLLSSPCLDFEI